MKQITNDWRIIKSNKYFTLFIRILNLNDWPRSNDPIQECETLMKTMGLLVQNTRLLTVYQVTAI